MKTKREQLEKLVHDMKAFADEVDASEDGASAEDLAKLNGMSADVKGLMDAIKSEATANGTIDLAKAFLGDLAGAPAASPEPEIVDGVVNPKGMTLGDAFVNSPAFGEFVKQFRGADGQIRNVSGIKSGEFSTQTLRSFGGFGAKDLITGASSTSGGAFVQADRLPGVTDLVGGRELTVDDLCTHIPIVNDAFEYVQVTGKTNNAAAVAEALNSDDGVSTANTTTGEITTAPASGVKPESAMTLTVVSSPVETIAHLIPITRRAAADGPQARALVDAFLLQGLAEEREDQILNGNGTSPNLKGILQTAGINTVGSAGTDIDAVVAAIAAIRAGRRRPNAMVVHPSDWYSTGFLLAKDTQGRYLLGDPRASIEQLNTLWGLRVVVTEAMTENTALVGDFSQAVVADRQQASIYVTDSHKDWFGRNLLAILAEERLGFGVLDPEAFSTVTAV